MNKQEAIERVSNNGWDLDELSDELKKIRTWFWQRLLMSQVQLSMPMSH